MSQEQNDQVRLSVESWRMTADEIVWPDGAQWRECAECGTPILVNRGSDDDLADEIFCHQCNTGEAGSDPVLVLVDDDGKIIHEAPLLAGV